MGLVRTFLQEETSSQTQRSDEWPNALVWISTCFGKKYPRSSQKWKCRMSSQVCPGGKAADLIFFSTGADTLTALLADKLVSASSTGPVLFPPSSSCCGWANYFHLLARKWRAIGVNVQEWRITHSFLEDRIYIFFTQQPPPGSSYRFYSSGSSVNALSESMLSRTFHNIKRVERFF